MTSTTALQVGCYTLVIAKIIQQYNQCKALSDNFLLPSCSQVAKINLLSAQRREQHILLMVLSMVSCYLLCWMPYGVMALAATFGRSGLVTPVASVVPAVLAKSSTVINPVIYVLFNNQVRGGAKGRTRGTMVLFTCRVAFTVVGRNVYAA